MDLRGKILLDAAYDCDSYLYVRDLLVNHMELITYNGNLLDRMIWKFWNWDNAKIKDLMEEFSVIYGEQCGWIDEYGDPLYIWQKLSTALDYYDVADSAVDINDPMQVLKKTLSLYRKMKEVI